MVKTTKFAVLFVAIGIALCATYFIWLQFEEDTSFVGLSHQDQSYKQEIVELAGDEVVAESDAIESDILAQIEKPVEHQRSPRPRTRSNTKSSFSPVLDQVVSQVQLTQDASNYIKKLEEMGLVTYLRGDKNKPVYRLMDGVINDPNSLHAYSEKTLEELVNLAQQDDPKAMLALANRSWRSGEWSEGDIYAIEAARISGSWEPILHGGLRRHSEYGTGFRDPEGASWLLAAYMVGETASAELVEAYFRFMSLENQQWALDRAYEVIDEVNNGG